MKEFVRDCFYMLTYKRITEELIEPYEIRLKRGEISFFNLSTNGILSFARDGEILYFRECPELLTGDAYWEKAIRRFFESLDRLYISKEHFSQNIPIRLEFREEEISSFQEYIRDRWRDRPFRKALSSADRTAQKYGFSIWEEQTYDCAFFERFALYNLPHNCWDIAAYFLWYIRSICSNYRLGNIVRGEQHSFFSASKAYATQIVAEELGLAHLITQSQWCRVVVEDGETYFGLLSTSAPGNRMCDQRIRPDGSLQKELLDLNMLDVICHQPDHGPNNYNVARNEDGKYSICAFDNDNPQTFFPWFSVFWTLAGCSPFADISGICRPYLDRDAMERLDRLNFGRLKRRLKPYLNPLQIAAVVYRICTLRRAVERTQRKNPDFLIRGTQWGEQTMEKEMSGMYGKTYLMKSEE